MNRSLTRFPRPTGPLDDTTRARFWLQRRRRFCQEMFDIAILRPIHDLSSIIGNQPDDSLFKNREIEVQMPAIGLPLDTLGSRFDDTADRIQYGVEAFANLPNEVVVSEHVECGRETD